MADWNRIHLPYIGSEYFDKQPRVVALGLNLNRHGGLTSQRDLIRFVQPALRQGKRRINFDCPWYGGTLYWHRLAMYATLLIREDWRIADDEVFVDEARLFDSSDTLSGAYDRIAHLELIKCSPPWRNSTPNAEMRSMCPPRFARYELEILEPDWLLVMGVATRKALSGCLAMTIVVRDEGTGAQIDVAETSQGRIHILTTPHPTSFGGTNSNLVARVAQLLKNQLARAIHVSRDNQQNNMRDDP